MDNDEDVVISPFAPSVPEQVDASTSDVVVIAGSVVAVIIVASIVVVVIVLLRYEENLDTSSELYETVPWFYLTINTSEAVWIVTSDWTYDSLLQKFTHCKGALVSIDTTFIIT